MIGVFSRHVKGVDRPPTRPYTGYVVGKDAVIRSPLAGVLREIRREERLSQVKLAELARVSLEPIKAIETEGHRPKAETLRKLADGAATNGAGQRDDHKADGFYERLLVAAGYIASRHDEEPEAQRPVDDLTDEEVVGELERRMGDREVAVSLLATANDWRQLPPKAKRLILDTIRYVRGDDDVTSSGEGRRR